MKKMGITLFIILSLFISHLYFSYDLNRLKYVKTIVHKNHVERRIQKKKPKNWVHLKEISKFTKWAIILSEDWSFYQHHGVDFEQIRLALSDFLTTGKLRGASTIAQQVVKNVFLTSERTLLRKFKELILTFKLERNLSKNNILEIYLNIIELGPDVYGIHQASWYYFKRAPSSLGPLESSFLAMLLPSPRRYSVSFRKKRRTPFARKRINSILHKMKIAGVISEKEFLREKKRTFSWEQ